MEKNVNKRYGIAIMALVASVTVILILLTTVTISGIHTANNAKKIAFGTEINMLQTAVDAYYTKNDSQYPVDEGPNGVVTLQIKNTGDILSQFESAYVVDGTDNIATLSKIDYGKINIDTSTLNYGKNESENDFYAISKLNEKVYYVKGLNIRSKTYYTLTDELKNLISYNSGKNTVSDPPVLFIPYTTEWTNSNMSVVVKVPKYYSEGTITVKQDNTEITIGEEDTSFIIYTIADIDSNCKITVDYGINDDPKQAVYTVSNIDKVSPDITVDSGNQVNMKNGDILGYFKVLSTSDPGGSGVKTVKYDYGNYTSVNAKVHFETNGYEVEDNNIYIKSGYSKITVYIEDNAGNTNTLLVDVGI